MDNPRLAGGKPVRLHGRCVETVSGRFTAKSFCYKSFRCIMKTKRLCCETTCSEMSS